MASFGELFPGVKKLRKESAEDEGDGELFEPGPLDLDGGVVRLRPRARRDEPADDDQTT